MRQFGKVDIPQEAFIQALKMGDQGSSPAKRGRGTTRSVVEGAFSSS